MKDITTGRFTIRADKETELMVRHEYELFRQSRLVEGKKRLSLNEFIIRLITEGLEMERMDRRNREAFYNSLVSIPSEGTL
tara:strand:- start:83 stop:325 length:243 start_codon:yes stop_codon:yes gene_type:complete